MVRDGALAQPAFMPVADGPSVGRCWTRRADTSSLAPSPYHPFAGTTGLERDSPQADAIVGVQLVKPKDCGVSARCGLFLGHAFIVIPVHRSYPGWRVQEFFVTSAGGNLTEVLDEPSSPRIEERLTSLGLSLTEGYRGEVNLAMEDWTGQLSRALDRGFILTIDYGQLATDLYSLQNNQGTLVCYHRHVVSSDLPAHRARTSRQVPSRPSCGCRRHGLARGLRPTERFLRPWLLLVPRCAPDARPIPRRTALSRIR